MAQTTNSVALGCALLEITRTLSCAAGWVDVSGSSSSLDGTEQTRLSGETYTFDGDGPIIQGGKREPMETTVVIVYTETDGEAFEYTRSEFESAGCGAHICLRYSPNGGAAGDAMYTTGAGILVSFMYPPVNATEGGPIVAQFTLKHGGFETTVVAPS